MNERKKMPLALHHVLRPHLGKMAEHPGGPVYDFHFSSRVGTFIQLPPGSAEAGTSPALQLSCRSTWIFVGNLMTLSLRYGNPVLPTKRPQPVPCNKPVLPSSEEALD